MNETINGQAQAKNGLKQINQFRTWLAEFRSVINDQIALYNKRLDDLEVLATKIQISPPITEEPIIDADIVRAVKPDRV